MGLLRLLIFFAFLYLIYKFIKNLSIRPQERSSNGQGSMSSGEDLVEDPYCHMYIPISKAYQAFINGKTLYFCSKKCFEDYASGNKTDV